MKTNNEPPKDCPKEIVDAGSGIMPPTKIEEIKTVCPNCGGFRVATFENLNKKMCSNCFTTW